jgi:membrane fusion protein (multidrug efflux system)
MSGRGGGMARLRVARMSSALARDTLAAPARLGRRGARRLAVAGATLALAAGGAWLGHGWWTTGRFIETTDDAYVGGNITALAPHIAGFVQQVLVADNQRVRAGQVLIRLDARDYRAARDRAEATLHAREASLAGLRAQAVLQQAAIRQQQAELAAKSAEAGFTAVDAARYRNLARSEAGSRQDAQRSTARDDAAQAAVAATAAALDAARAQLQVLAAHIAEAEADLAAARADLHVAELNLDYTEIRAPVDGYVGNRAAQVGAYVTAGTYLITVIPVRDLWVDANFKEDQLTRMVAGEAATVRADVMPGHTLQGHVASLSPGTGAVFSVIPPENATGNFTKIVQRVPVRIVLNADGDPVLRLLRPGLSVTVSVDTRTAAR